MARVKKKRVVKRSPAQSSTKNLDISSETSRRDFASQIKLGESYISLILGGIVVLGLSVVFFLFIRGNDLSSGITPVNEDALPSGVVNAPISRSHVLAEGESLWDVAVKYYGDGYRYTEIIEANKLENPDYVPPGTRLTIPNTR